MSKYLKHHKILIDSYYRKLQAELPLCKVYIEIRNHKKKLLQDSAVLSYYSNISLLHLYFVEMSAKSKVVK